MFCEIKCVGISRLSVRPTSVAARSQFPPPFPYPTKTSRLCLVCFGDHIAATQLLCEPRALHMVCLYATSLLCTSRALMHMLCLHATSLLCTSRGCTLPHFSAHIVPPSCYLTSLHISCFHAATSFECTSRASLHISCLYATSLLYTSRAFTLLPHLKFRTPLQAMCPWNPRSRRLNGILAAHPRRCRRHRPN